MNKSQMIPPTVINNLNWIGDLLIIETKASLKLIHMANQNITRKALLQYLQNLLDGMPSNNSSNLVKYLGRTNENVKKANKNREIPAIDLYNCTRTGTGTGTNKRVKGSSGVVLRRISAKTKKVIAKATDSIKALGLPIISLRL